MGKIKDNKQGNVVLIMLPIGIAILLLILFVFAILYAQIITVVISIKQDIFYAVHNALVKTNLDEMSYSNYVANESEIKQIVEDVLIKSYMGESSSVIKIEVQEINYYINKAVIVGHTKGVYSEPIIHVDIKVTFKPVVNIGNMDKYIINIHDDVKMALLGQK